LNQFSFQLLREEGNVLRHITMGQVFHVATLVLSQLQEQTGELNADLLIATLRGATALYKSKLNRP
jgi:hypothetical protein